MALCNDCWCEYYDKGNTICDQCPDKNLEKDNPELRIILTNRVTQQTDYIKSEKSTEQTR